MSLNLDFNFIQFLQSQLPLVAYVVLLLVYNLVFYVKARRFAGIVSRSKTSNELYALLFELKAIIAIGLAIGIAGFVIGMVNVLSLDVTSIIAGALLIISTLVHIKIVIGKAKAIYAIEWLLR